MQFGPNLLIAISRTPPVRVKRLFGMFQFFSSSHSGLCRVVSEPDQRFSLMRTHPSTSTCREPHLFHDTSLLTNSPIPKSFFLDLRVHSHVSWPFQCLLPPVPLLTLQSSHMEPACPPKLRDGPPCAFACAVPSTLSKSNLSIQLPRPCLHRLFLISQQEGIFLSGLLSYLINLLYISLPGEQW